MDASQKASQRRMVSKWSRKELEDKYLQQYEENVILKKQGDQIKCMATQLVTLIGDKEKREDQGARGGASKKRDIETKEMLEELQSRIRELERENGATKEKKKTEEKHSGDNVTISVGHLRFHANAPVYKDKEVNKVFVEYRFLDVSPNETETPCSLPKAPPDESINFNFTKIFSVDYEMQYKRRQHLAARLLKEDTDNGRLRFTVVAEPEEEDDDGDCKEVGVAFVSLPEMLKKNKDVEDEDIPIYDAESETTEIGLMNVTVKCVDALKAVQAEMTQPPPSYEQAMKKEKS